MDWLDLLAVHGTLKSLLQHYSSKASILRHSAFFTVHLSHPYMTTGKTIALTRQTFVGKVMSLLFNMLSRLVITFLPRNKRLIDKLRLKLKKVGKTTRPFRYGLNKIPYHYTVEVRNRLKGLDLIDRVPDELWMRFVTLYRRQGSRPSPWKRNAKKQNGCLRRSYK